MHPTTHPPTHSHTHPPTHAPHTLPHTYLHRLVEEAVSNGSVESAFPCPPINHTHHDIILPDLPHDSLTLVSITTTHPHTHTNTHTQLEKIALTVVVVIVIVIIANFVMDRLCRKLRGCGRSRPFTTSVLYLNRRSSDSEEACALLIQEEAAGEGVDDSHVGVNGNFNNNSQARVEVCGSDGVEVCGGDGVEVCRGDDVKTSGDTVEVCSGDGVEVCVHTDNESRDILVTDNLTFDLDITVPFEDNPTEPSFHQPVEPTLINIDNAIDDGCHGDDDDEADETSKLLPVQVDSRN